MKVILFNGPRGVGKDTAAATLMKPERRLAPVMRTIKRDVLGHYGIDCDLVDVYDSVKDTVLAEFGEHSTFRNAIIAYANHVRSLEPYTFAKRWADEVRGYRDYTPEQIIIVPDVRFFEEFIIACDLVGGKNVLLARVYRDGCDWTGDVGGYIRTDMAVFGNGEISLYNNWDRDGFELEAKVLVGMWLKQHG